MAKKKIAILDADTFVWVACYHNRDRDESTQMIQDLDTYLVSLLSELKVDGYCGFLKGTAPDFRRGAFDDYKANRPTTPEFIERWKSSVVFHLTGFWGMEKVDRIEADDACASAQLQLLRQPDVMPILCSQDKDFNQIPGWHYNTRKKEMFELTEGEAFDNLLIQICKGDAVDNIPGLAGIGDVKAKRMVGKNDPEAIIRALEAYVRQWGTTHRGFQEFVYNAFKVVLRDDPSFKFTIHDFKPSEDANREIRNLAKEADALFSQ